MNVKTKILIGSSWSNVWTLTNMTQLGCMWSISWYIQHLAQRQDQHTIQCNMLLQRAFLHFELAHSTNQLSNPHIDGIMQDRLEGRKGTSLGSIAQLAIQQEAFWGETTGNALFKQWQESDMDWGLCGWRDHCGKKASSRRRNSDYARADQYDYSWKCGDDNWITWNNFWRNIEFYRRQSEWSCKFRRRAVWRSQGRW